MRRNAKVEKCEKSKDFWDEKMVDRIFFYYQRAGRWVGFLFPPNPTLERPDDPSFVSNGFCAQTYNTSPSFYKPSIENFPPYKTYILLLKTCHLFQK